jgi:glucokinase-like ROK family protein
MSYSPEDKSRLAVAIDIGGTSIKAGVIREDGQLLAVHRALTPSKAPPEHIVLIILDLVAYLCRHSALSLRNVEGIGISIAAFITAHGVITATAHLSQEWIGYDLHGRLSSDLLSNYYFALDTPAPTLGEAYFGAGKGVQDCVYVTVSTGIGAGIMAGGKYFVGGLGWAGGIGHTIIDETSDRVCSGCGNAGCLETFAATQGFLATTRELVQSAPHSLILALANGNLEDITPRIVFEAAQQNDSVANEVWKNVGHTLGIGLTNLINIVSPRRVIIGGGISQAGDYLLDPVRSVIRSRAFPPQHRATDVVRAALGDLSGIFGAAAMVFHDLRINALVETPI